MPLLSELHNRASQSLASVLFKLPTTELAKMAHYIPLFDASQSGQVEPTWNPREQFEQEGLLTLADSIMNSARRDRQSKTNFLISHPARAVSPPHGWPGGIHHRCKKRSKNNKKR